MRSAVNVIYSNGCLDNIQKLSCNCCDVDSISTSLETLTLRIIDLIFFADICYTNDELVAPSVDIE